MAADAPEALIREARRRTRRRRLSAAALLVLIVGLVAAYLQPAGSEPRLFKETAGSPYANARAFSGHGELAFVSRDQLWVLDGRAGVLRHLRVPALHTASVPSFSRDGRWLAYLVEPTNPNYHGTFELWIAHGDGSGAHRVAGVRADRLVGWSPRADLLAVTGDQQLHAAPYGSPTVLQLVTPGDGVRTLVRAVARPRSRRQFDAIGGATWSPSGTRLAVVLQAGALVDEIETVPAAGSGRARVWFRSASGPVPIRGMAGRIPTGLIPELAGWWSRWGIAFWVIDFGAADNRDNTPLAVIRGPGQPPRYLAQTLSLGITEAVAPGPDGRLALVAAGAGGREFAAGKTVETCAPASGSCRALPGATSWPLPFKQRCPCFPARTVPGRPGSGVSQDPQWSPNGRLLAYEKAPTTLNGAWPSNSWFAQHQVYVWNSQTGVSRRVGTVNGSALPSWSADGKDLMYESGDGLWLMPVATGRSVRIVHPLYPESAWNNKVSHLGWISYYGQIPWHDQFGWWSPSR